MRGNMGRPGMGSTSGGVIDALGRQTSGGSTGIADHRWLLGARISLASGTENLAYDYIRTDDTMYLGEILEFGFSERSIEAPPGPPRIGDCQIRIKDTDRRFRSLLSTQTGLRRLIELVRITDQAVVGGFEIMKWSFGPGWVEVRGRDILSKINDKYIPSIGTRTNFPYMVQGQDEFFGNIVIGNQFSSVDNPQGRVPCDHIGETTTEFGAVAVDRYCISRFPLFIDATSLPVVYRKLRTDGSFSVVDPSEYIFTKNEIVGDYTPTFLDFLAVQDEDALVRIDTYGFETVQDIGTFTVLSWNDPNPLRNPVDAISKMQLEAMLTMGGDIRFERYNTDSFVAMRAYCDAQAYVCDGTISRRITYGAFLSWMQTSFEFDYYVNRHYQYEVALVVDTDPDRLVITEEFDFLESEPQTPDTAFNRINYRYSYNSATGQWAGSGTFDNEADQAELGNVDYQGNDDQIEAQDVVLPFVDDSVMALTTITRRAAYVALGSHRVTFEVPLPEFFERLELGQLIGFSDALGLADGGWVNKEFKILALRHDFGRLVTTVKAILRAPVVYGGGTGSGPVGGLIFIWN